MQRRGFLKLGLLTVLTGKLSWGKKPYSAPMLSNVATGELSVGDLQKALTTEERAPYKQRTFVLHYSMTHKQLRAAIDNGVYNANNVRNLWPARRI